MAKLTRFPEKYPYTSDHGFVFTKEIIEKLFKEMQLYLFQKRINANEYNLDIAELILRMINHFDPSFEVPIELFGKLTILKQVHRANSRKRKMIWMVVDGERIRVPIREVEITENMVLCEDRDLPSYKDELTDIMRFVKRALGNKYEEFLEYRGLDYTETQIAEIMGISRTTAARMSLKIKEVLMEYSEND